MIALTKTERKAFPCILLLAACLLVSCFDDDSTAWTTKVGEITVEGIESSYTKTAYVHEHLTINPIVETGYPESDMEYQWVLINDKTGTTTAAGDTIQPMEIGTEKNLDYDVAIAPGSYQIRFIAKAKSNGYTSLTTSSLTVQTDFSQGFYILKETSDGNTELDLLNTKDILSQDLLAGVKGSPLIGKPSVLCPNYNMGYINADTDEMDTNNGLIITTESNNFLILRTTDLATMFDRSNLKYDEMEADEAPLGMYSTSMDYIIMITSKGLYSQNSGGTGQFGLPVTELCGSPYYYHDFSSYGGGALWDAKTHSITAYNYNMADSPLTDMSMQGEDVTQNLTSYDCLYCGFNYLSRSSQGQFVLRDNNTGNRYLYLISGGFSGQYLSSRTLLGGHMASATHYACNGKSASYIYCAEGGKLYACITNSDDLSEVELKPEGIPSNESINFVANQFWSGSFSGGKAFDYLIVGTQSGDNYKLYFYETNGGAPMGAPIKKVEGTGKVKKVRFVNPTFSTTDWLFGYHVFNNND